MMLQRFLLCLFVLAAAAVARAQNVQHLQAWNEFRTLKSTDAHDGDWFGISNSVDTHYAAVGAPLHDFAIGATASSNSSSADYKEDAGSAYLYGRFGSDWELHAKLVAQDRALGDKFGTSVSVSGMYAAVGAPESKTDATGGSSLTQAGAVYIFQRISGSWTQVAKIVAPDRAASDFFGQVVAIRGVNLFVGAPYEDEDPNQQNTLNSAGSVYHFVRSGAQWTFVQKLVAGDRAAGHEFGTSISVNDQTLAVGAKMASGASAGLAGAAYVFAPNNGQWTQVTKLTASDGVAFDGFGTSLSVFGNRIAVGSPGHSSVRGAVYLYSNNLGWSQTQKISASDAQNGDRFGYSVALFKDTLAVGAPKESHNTLGTSASTTSQHDYLANAGSVYVFHHANAQWTQSEKVAALGRIAEGELGYSVALYREDLMAGAPFAANPLTQQGTTWLIGKDKFVWTGTQSSDPNNGLNWMLGAIPPTQHEFIYRKGSFDPEYTEALNASIITVWDLVEIKVVPHTNSILPQPTVIGTELHNRGRVNLLANSTGYTALRIGRYEGSGTVRQEQVIPNMGWYQIGSPMQGGWPNLAGGDSTKLIPWEEQHGQYGAQGYLLEEFGRGFFSQVASTGAYGTGPFMSAPSKISVEGRPNTLGAFTVGYANNPSPANAQYTTGVTAGWNLVANPFTCPLDFVWLGRTRMDNSYTVWNQSLNSGQGGYEYYSFSGGSLTRYIPPFQAFWVRAQDQTAGIAPTSISVSGTVTTLPAFRKRALAGIRFSVLDASGSVSDAVWATPLHGSNVGVADLDRDALKRMNAPTLPNIFAVVGGVAMATKGLDAAQIQELDLHLKLPQAEAMWRLEAELSDTTSGAWYVVDRTNNLATLIQDGWSESIHFDPADSVKYALRFVPYGILEGGSTEPHSRGYVFQGTEGPGYVHHGPKATYEVVDAMGRTLITGAVEDGATVVWTQLASGIYVVRIAGDHGQTYKFRIP